MAVLNLFWLAGVKMRLKPGGTGEPPWHKESEWALVDAGPVLTTTIDPEDRSLIDDVGTGDTWRLPAGIRRL